MKRGFLKISKAKRVGQELPMFLLIFLGVVLLGSACSSSTIDRANIDKSFKNPRTTVSKIATPPDLLPSLFFDPPIFELTSKAAIQQLHLENKDGEVICNDRYKLEVGDIPDYAERKIGELVPLLPSALADLYAIGAAAVVYKSYETLIDAWESLEVDKLLCISRLIAQPRLEVDWLNFRYLLRNNKRITQASTPFRIATVAIRPGEAIVMGCLAKNAYGTASKNQISPPVNSSFLFESALAWIGGRWRVQSVQDYFELGCDELTQLISKKHQELDVTKDRWILSSSNNNWNWNKKEVTQWINS